MSNTKIKFYLIILVIFHLLSCDANIDNSNSYNSYNSLEFKYLPSSYNIYNAELYFIDDSDNEIGNKNISNISSDGIQSFEVKIPSKAKSITVLLYIPDYDEPLYFSTLTASPDNLSYSFQMWFMFEQFLYRDRYVFGTSKDLVTKLDRTSDFTINFEDQPYYIFKVESPYDYTYLLTQFSTIGSNISVYSSTDIEILYDSIGSFRSKSYSWSYNKEISTFYVLVTPENPFVNIISHLKLNIDPIFPVNAVVKDLIHISDSNKLIATTDNESKLYVIDIENRIIEEEINIGITNISDIAYSSLKNTIYGVSSTSDELFTYNVDTKELAIFTYHNNDYSYKLEIDEYNNMIYIAASGIYRANLNDLTIFESIRIENRDRIKNIYFNNDFVFFKDSYDLFQAIRTNDGFSETSIKFSDYEFENTHYDLNPDLSKVVIYNRNSFINTYDVGTQNLDENFSDDPETIGSLFFNSTGTHFYTVENGSQKMVRYNVDDPADFMDIYIPAESSNDIFVVNENETALFGSLTLGNGDNIIFIHDINVE